MLWTGKKWLPEKWIEKERTALDKSLHKLSVVFLTRLVHLLHSHWFAIYSLCLRKLSLCLQRFANCRSVWFLLIFSTTWKKNVQILLDSFHMLSLDSALKKKEKRKKEVCYRIRRAAPIALPTDVHFSSSELWSARWQMKDAQATTERKQLKGNSDLTGTNRSKGI